MAKHQRQAQQTNQAPAQGQDLQPLIAQKAYELWEQNGRVEGQDLEHWLEAERLVKAQGAFQRSR